MAAGELAAKTLHELRALLDRGAASPREVLDDVLARIERLNPSIHAYAAVDPDRVRRQLDAPAARSGPLRGLPVTIKDNICVAGEETACASRILRGFRPPYDATVIERLRLAGAILIPRANMDEFAFGSSTENSALGPTRNPRAEALDRVPGGSSGGSAAAVAADMAIAALGSDTGGSIRQPAAFCGVVGLKPTYGRVSRYGLVAFASSLDQVGPLAKDAEDAALLLTVIAGQDARDSTSQPMPVPDYAARLEQPVQGLTIGVPVLGDAAGGVEPAVRDAVSQAVRAFERLGCRTVPIELPTLQHAIATYYIVATAEASSNLARYDGVRYGMRAGEADGGRALLTLYERTRTEGFGAEAQRRILLGTYVLSHGYYDAYYLQGMKVRTLITQDFDQAFTRCQAIALPTAPTVAFRFGEKLDDPLQMYLSDIFTISANLAGIPALSLCCGADPAGLPIGLQLLAAPFQEELLLRLARAYERDTEWPRRRASLRTGG